MLETAFAALLARHGAAENQTATLWREIEGAYSGWGRHYHTLAHLRHMLAELEPHAALPEYDVLLFGLFYHDLIYNPLRDDNEARSAARAGDVLRGLGVSSAFAAQCEALIRATSHLNATAPNPDFPTALFLDADLAILGAEPDVYDAYVTNVRLEYTAVPDRLFRTGRRQVLEHFLAQPAIFRTPEFRERYEAAARQNLMRELAKL